MNILALLVGEGYTYLFSLFVMLGKDDMFVRRDLSKGEYRVNQEDASKFSHFHFDGYKRRGDKEEL